MNAHPFALHTHTAHARMPLPRHLQAQHKGQVGEGTAQVRWRRGARRRLQGRALVARRVRRLARVAAFQRPGASVLGAVHAAQRSVGTARHLWSDPEIATDGR
jgi:hypothetical protein